MFVVLVPHEKGIGGVARRWGEHDEAATMWRLWNIVIPLCQLAGAQVMLSPTRQHAESMRSSGDWWPDGAQHFIGPLVEAARRGETIPKLRATVAARRYVGKRERLVTLTLRDQTTQPERNSDKQSWAQFAMWLRSRQYDVVTLNDTHNALRDSRGHWAEISVDMRAALYASATMNCIGNNGPCVLLWFSDAPYMQVGYGHPRDKWEQYCIDHQSLKWDDQLPWATSRQRLVWEPDTLEMLVSSFPIN